MSLKNVYLPKSFIEKGNDFKSVDLDTALELAGYGKFHYKIIAISAICLLTNGFQNGLPSYVFPSAEKSLKITSVQIGFLNVAFQLGGISSAFLWGSLADSYGRRKILIITLISDFLVTTIWSCISDYRVLIFCRFSNGFLIGAPGTIVFNYLAEFHAAKIRSKSVCYLGAAFTLSWPLLPTIAYFILPLDLQFESWRVFVFLLAIPELLTGLWLIRMPETPRYLVNTGQTEEALIVLKAMHWDNRRSDFAINCLRSESEVNACGKLSVIFKNMLKQMRRLFRSQTASLTVLISCIMFCNMFSYIGLGLWLPELFLRFQYFEANFPNDTFTVKDLASMVIDEDKVFDFKLFESTLMIGTCCVMGNLMSGYMNGKVSQRLVPVLTMALGAIASGSIYFLRSSWENLLVACLFQGAMATGNVAIGSVAVELIPSSVAAVGLCFVILFGRIGAMVSNLIFGLFMDTRCELPIFLVSGALLLGTFLCLFIPGRNKKVTWLGSNKLHIDIAVISEDNV
ncbi:PREDICTED: synaptic vesicle glycoprotein 2B-like [Nicrophorus vespilloides]|uniref:Synaptic vesicle glycoprotein 2B-like n=1 Tax=Nicrophorus vespilloides TaxID=110193 RepID=A0ABM1N9T1_NICVS|nr:PREDICTED: synaptic vesicle glycoprotein 2B-like [Nicrophorus vespilloides]